MYYIYQTTNLVNNKIYIGVHCSNNIQNDNYLGSGKLIKLAIKKYGEDNFKRKILCQFLFKQEAYKMQKQIVNEEFLKRKDIYNIKIGGRGGWFGKGIITVKDPKTNKIFQINKNDQKWLNKQLVGITKGSNLNTIAAKDENGNKFKIKTQQFYKLKQKGTVFGVTKGTKMPTGFAVGQKNSQYGTMWITNGRQNKKIKKDQVILQGWRKGRICKLYNN